MVQAHLDMAEYKVYEIKFPDGCVYYGYTAKPFELRLNEHITSSQKGKSKLYKKMRLTDYDCTCRIVNTFPDKETALEWERKLIKRTPYDRKLNTSWGGEDGENNQRRWRQQDIIKKHYRRKNRKDKYRYEKT